MSSLKHPGYGVPEAGVQESPYSREGYYNHHEPEYTTPQYGALDRELAPPIQESGRHEYINELDQVQPMASFRLPKIIPRYLWMTAEQRVEMMREYARATDLFAERVTPMYGRGMEWQHPDNALSRMPTEYRK